jgi:restriction system protein
MLKTNEVWLGLDGVGDLLELPTRQSLMHALADLHEDLPRNAVASLAVQLWSFAQEIREGDLVAVSSPQIAIGAVTGRYRFEPESEIGMRHRRRVRWLRTGVELASIGADLLPLFSTPLFIRRLDRNDAANRLARLAEQGRDISPRRAVQPSAAAQVLAKAQEAPQDSPVSMTVRELLLLWDHQQRLPAAVEEVKAELLRAGMTTRPPFTEGDLDRKIALVRIETETAPADEATVAETPGTEDLTETGALALQISNFPEPTEPISDQIDFQAAQMMMVERNYSQVAVVDGHGRFQGALTWETIMRAHLAPGETSLAQALDRRAQVVYRDELLLEKIDLIFEKGFVFVYSFDRRQVDGILTAGDLMKRLGAFLEPFVKIEEIENRLRRAVNNTFQLDEYAKYASISKKRVRSAANLMLGNYVKLLDDNWDRFAWQMPKEEFLSRLKRVKEIRNEIMHFSPDPLTDEQTEAMDGLLRMLTVFVPDHHS